MTPETEKLIASYPEMSDETAKKIFIRDNAIEAYNSEEENALQESGENLLKVVGQLIVKDMSKEQISAHIGNLEKAREYLACHTQGLMIAHSKKIQPEIEAKRKREAKAKGKKRGIEASLDKLGLDLNTLLNSIPIDSKDLDKKIEKPGNLKKETCPKCKKETYALSLHSC